ncbi:MAG: class I SAM-dependent methyltransferase [Phycisphaerae bacterium]|nr:class I SAM-dependent methyltransferase [Phycisphaerae bacterium]
MNDKISSEKTIEHPVYERRWEYAIKSGKIQLGNLQTNLAFLEQTGLVDNGKTALELGCGSGQLASFFYKKGVSIIASDISETAIDHARKLYPDVMFQTHSAEELPYEDGSFDIVMSFDVLEHLPNVAQHLREVRRVLKPDGYYLFQTPNKLSNAIFETLKCRSMAWKKYHPSLHFYGQLKRRLKHCGFDPHFIKMNTMNEFAVNKFKRVGLPGWLVSWISFRYLPFRLQTNFYVIAKKVTGS